jgi:hypothetical protein
VCLSVIKGRCFSPVQSATHYSQAQHVCRMWGGSVASVRDDTDFDFMKQTMGSHDFWIGLQLVQSPNGDTGQAHTHTHTHRQTDTHMVTMNTGLLFSSSCSPRAILVMYTRTHARARTHTVNIYTCSRYIHTYIRIYVSICF